MSSNGPTRTGVAGTLRSLARITSLLVVGFLLVMFVGESLEPDRGPPGARGVDVAGAVGLLLNFVYAGAMVIALKWERAGLRLGAGAMALFFAMVFLGLFHGNVAGGFSTRGIFNPFLLAFWVPIALYAACRFLEARPRAGSTPSA